MATTQLHVTGDTFTHPGEFRHHWHQLVHRAADNTGTHPRRMATQPGWVSLHRREEGRWVAYEGGRTVLGLLVRRFGTGEYRLAGRCSVRT